MKTNSQPNFSATSTTAFGEDLIAEMNANQLKLHSFTEIGSMPDAEPWTSIKLLYNSPRFRDKAAACLINGAISSDKRQFLLSQRALQGYLQEDPNVNRNWIKGPDFSKAMDFFLASINGANILRCVSKYQKNGRGEGRNLAGTYEIAHPKILPFLSTLDGTHQQYSPVVLTESTRGLSMCMDGREPGTSMDWNGVDQPQDNQTKGVKPVEAYPRLEPGMYLECVNNENTPLERGEVYALEAYMSASRTVTVVMAGKAYGPYALTRFEMAKPEAAIAKRHAENF